MMTEPDLEPAGPYETALDIYHERGWHPLPVVGKAGNLPAGHTGWDGTNPTHADLWEWVINGRGADNICLRLTGVIGIDVDAYQKGELTKRGNQTMRWAVQQWGELPKTWRTTARDADNPSGIYYYQVPPGTVLQTIITGANPDGEPVSDVEIIQYGHRYAVAPPSIHPDTGTTYRWFTPDGLPSVTPPAVAELPQLPQAWVDALTRQRHQPDRDAVDYTPQTAPRHEWWPPVEAYYQQGLTAATGAVGARHDAVLAIVGALARLESNGETGATTALEELRGVFVGAVEGDRPRGEAEREYQRMLDSSRDMVAVTTSTYEPADRIGVRAEGNGHTGDTTPPLNGGTEPTTPAPGLVDLTHWWDNEQPHRHADVLHREDGTALLYIDQLNWIHGDSGSGKTWILLKAVTQLLNDGHRIMWVHYEDPNPGTVLSRLKLLGATRQQVLEQFFYYDPQGEPFNGPAITGLCLEHDIEFVALDSVGEALNASGISENEDSEVGPWLTNGPRILVNHGIGFCGVDHGTKEGKHKLHPSGSKRKRAALTGAGLLVEAIDAPTVDRDGAMRIIMAKDRHGNHAQGHTVALAHLRHTPTGMTFTVDTPNLVDVNRDEDHEKRVREVVRAVDTTPGITKNKVLPLMHTGGKDKKRAAISDAIDRGLVRSEPGPRDSHELYPIGWEDTNNQGEQ